MRFFLQLKLLLWKNFLVRKRNKVRCIAEILWPLFLFLILMWVRTRGLTTDIPEKHYKEKAMPSAGQGAFLHSFICNAANSPHTTEPSPYYSSSSKALGALSDVLNSGERLKKISSKASDLEELIARLSRKDKLPGTSVLARDLLPESQWVSLGAARDASLDRTQVNAALQQPGAALCPGEPCALPPHVWQDIANQAPGYSESGVSKHMEPWEWLRLNALLADISSQQDAHRSLAEHAVAAVEAAMSNGGLAGWCDTLDMAAAATTSSPMQSRQRLALHLSEMVAAIDPCSALENITSSSTLAWTVIQPLVLGQIYFYPDNQATRKVMQKVNETIASVLTAPSGVVSIGEISFLNRADELQDLFQTEVGSALLRSGTAGAKLQDITRSLRSFAASGVDASTVTPVQVIQLFLVALKQASTCINFDKIKGYSDVDKARDDALTAVDENKLWALVEFDDIGEVDVGKAVSYKIRMSQDSVDNGQTLVDLAMNLQSRDNPLTQLKYLTYGFAFLQDMLDSAIISIHSGRDGDKLPGRTLQQEPFHAFVSDTFVISISHTFPLFMVLAWIYTASMIVKSIVYEKEERIKETLSVMGLSNGVHWAGWFIDNFLFMFVTIVLMSIILVYGRIIEHADFSVTLVFLLSYSLSTISFCFLLSALFSKATIAAVATGSLFFLTYLPYQFVQTYLNDFSIVGIKSVSLLSNIAFGLATDVLADWEQAGIGAQWSNWDTPPNPGDVLCLSTCVYMLWVDTLIYGILTWYIEAVWPGEYGVPRRFYFFLTKSYWFGPSEKDFHSSGASRPVGVPINNLEPEPQNNTVGVSIEGLTKVFGKKTAVNGLSLNFYQDQITCFLGHNGAGKTTTISMLTGMYPPSGGTARIYGLDIRSDMDSIRSNIGICPQHNVLFSSLSVEEHLYFFGRIKGQEPESLRAEIDRMLQDMGLQDKRTALSTELSGGMKRKLSIGMAFVGGSRTVFLDEPTAGVDPFSRRAIWEILIKYREARTVILTTHFMDEADLLGDRIAIISDGQLQCCGSSVFLKARFGSGYYLTVEMRNPARLQELQYLVERCVPGVQLVQELGMEAVFILPDRNDVQSITKVLQSLDNAQEGLEIESYGVSDTSLEEIFLRVAGSKETVEPSDSGLTLNIDDAPMNKDKGFSAGYYEGWALLWSQFLGLCLKRLQFDRRSPKAIITQIVFPAVFLAIALLTLNFTPSPTDAPDAVFLDIDMFASPHAGYFEARQDPAGVANPWTDKYIQSMITNGVGPSHMDSNTRSLAQSPRILRQTAHFIETNSKGDCTLADGLAYVKLPTGEIFYNLTQENVPQWIVDSYDYCKSNRFGGVTYGTAYPYMQMLDSQLPYGSLKSKPDNVRIWYNNKGISSSVAYQNAINNVLLRASVSATGTSAEGYGITAFNHPLPRTEKQSEKKSGLISALSVMYVIPILFVLSFVPASFVIPLIEDRTSQCKHLQLMSGMRRYIYWMQSYTWDLASFVVTEILMIIVIVAFNNPVFMDGINLLADALLIFFFGAACIPLLYLFTWFFEVSSLASVVLACANLFVGIGTTLSVLILGLFDDPDLKNIGDILKYVFLIFPQFCLGQGLLNVATEYSNKKMYEQYHQNKQAKGALDWDVTGLQLLMMVVQTVVLVAAALALEYRSAIKQRFLHLIGRHSDGTPPDNGGPLPGEDDVVQERFRVSTGRADVDVLVLKDLCKSYRKDLPPAVNRVSLGVRRGECFGLLGLNGAGKTTTFKMLTGAEDVTSGDAFVDGTSIREDMDTVRKSIGYCPQFDALTPKLTAREHLDLHCRLRGMLPGDRVKAVQRVIDQLNLAPHQHKQSQALSGGNKRKLSTAIALVGGPTLLFMDEPTTSMDPGARRFLWDCVLAVVDSGRSVVLTSHSMEECQALCTKLTIMVNGQLTCFGSPQHLKSKYGSGYSVMVRCPLPRVREARQLVMQRLRGAAVVEAHLNQIKFHIPQTNEMKLANIFRALEDARREGSVLDYSISQTTLEDVFMRFAQLQAAEIRPGSVRD